MLYFVMIGGKERKCFLKLQLEKGPPNADWLLMMCVFHYMARCNCAIYEDFIEIFMCFAHHLKIWELSFVCILLRKVKFQHPPTALLINATVSG